MLKRDAKVLREIRSPTSKQGLDDSIVASKRARKCLGMKQVQAILKGMGVTDDQEELNYCTLAAIKKGHLICQGMPEDLDIVILETKGDCGHKVRVTLRDMLQQSDKPEGSGHIATCTGLSFCALDLLNLIMAWWLHWLRKMYRQLQDELLEV